MNRDDLLNYVLRIGDNCLILGQRLAEWCGHGPVLEQDIAMTNIALDLIGQARNYYQYAARIKGEGDEDSIALLRAEHEYANLQLVEQPNGDFAQTVLRQYFFDVFHLAFLEQLQHSRSEQLASIAIKSIKEVNYHKRWSAQWVLRLGDGTKESHERLHQALDHLWKYAFEAFAADELDETMSSAKIGVDLSSITQGCRQEIEKHLKEAALSLPTSKHVQTGGKAGKHSEHMGYILAEMQFMQRAYPGAKW